MGKVQLVCTFDVGFMAHMLSDGAVSKAIIDTLVFFRMFGRPLSRAELLSWLWGQDLPAMPEETVLHEALEALRTTHPDILLEHEGFFYLESRAEYPDRTEQKRINAQLRAKSFRYLPSLRYIPGIRFCALANTVAFDAAEGGSSDIDLFIIARRGMLWWVRICVTILLHLQGVRRHGNKVASRFCLSFFVDETAMDLSQIAIPDDVYLRYWIATLYPVFGTKTYHLFQDVNREFMKVLPVRKPPTSARNGGNAFWEKFLLGAGRPLLTFVRFIQRSKMKHLPVRLGPGAHVVVNDHMLKFHNNDRRQHYRDIWHEDRQRLYTLLSLE